MTCQLPEHRFDEHGNCRGCPTKIPANYFASEPDERAAIQSVEAEEERKDHIAHARKMVWPHDGMQVYAPPERAGG